MAYKQKHKYGFRDSLEKGNPEKVIYGDYFDDEFEAIEQAIADIDPNSDGGVDIDEIDGLQEELDKKIEEAPNDGKQYVRESEAWAEVAIPDDTGIPEPPGDSKPYSRIRAAGRDDGSWTAAFSIEDASTDGEILHWDDSAKEWISNSSFTIEGAGINALLAVVDGSGAFYTSRGNGGGIYCSTGSVTPVYNKAPSDGEVDFGSSDNKWKDGYFSGAIDASQFTVNGAEIPTSEDIEYLDGRIDAIEGNISGGGGFVEAPDNGDDYARNGKSPAWVKTYNAEYIDALETDYKNADADKADKDHDHIIGDVTDLQAALDGKADADHNHEGDYAPADHNHEGDYAPADHNHEGDYAPADHNHEGDYAALNHTHTTDEIIGLDDKIDEIEDDITDLEGAVGSIAGQLAMGGSYDASTGLVVTANLSEFTSGQPLPDYSTVPNTFVIVSVAGDNPEELGEGDWLVAGQSGWVSIKYGTAGSVEWDNIQNVPSEFPPEAHNHDGLWEQNGSDIYYSDGNVGIGTDSPSGSQLHIKKAGNVISKIESEGTGWAYTEVKNTAGNWLFGMNSGSGGEFKIYDKKSAEDRLTIDSDGNVGIGDSDSSRKLSVVDSKSVVSRFESTGAIGGQISFSDSTTSDPDGVDVRIGSIGDELHAFTGNQSRLTIDNEGDATFSGSVFLQDQNARFFWNGTAGQTRLFSNGGLQIRTGGFTEPDTALTIDASGNVGIGTDSPGYPLHVFGDARFQESGIGGITIKIEDAAESGIGKARVGLHQHNAETDFFIGQTPDNNLGGSKPNATYNFYTHNFQTVGTTRLTIDNEGDATFSGVVEANRYKGLVFEHKTDSDVGFEFSSANKSITPWNSTNGTATSGVLNLGTSGSKFKNAHFSGTVNAKLLLLASNGATRIDLNDTSNATGKKSIRSNQGELQIVDHDYAKTIVRISDTGNIDAAGFTINGAPISGGGGGLPDGGYTYGDTITAVDFIATSDERAKVKIKTAPVGIIDSLKGREWDWKESGEKGSGVVAQELEQVLPHLVHEDDEGMKSVAYNGLIAYLIEEIKDLKAQVEALK